MHQRRGDEGLRLSPRPAAEPIEDRERRKERRENDPRDRRAWLETTKALRERAHEDDVGAEGHEQRHEREDA